MSHGIEGNRKSLLREMPSTIHKLYQNVENNTTPSNVTTNNNNEGPLRSSEIQGPLDSSINETRNQIQPPQNITEKSLTQNLSVTSNQFLNMDLMDLVDAVDKIQDEMSNQNMHPLSQIPEPKPTEGFMGTRYNTDSIKTEDKRPYLDIESLLKQVDQESPPFEMFSSSSSSSLADDIKVRKSYQ